MHRLQLHYTLSRESSPALVRNPLLDLLRAVSSAGSISAAARALGLSYRHVWGELKRWEQALGSELVVWEKGQPARLTSFGARLMWAERQAQARLAPQIEALRTELERAFAAAFDAQAPVVSLFASHDAALVCLREHALAQAQLHLDIRYVGSVDALRGLNEGRCVMAALHTLVASTPDSQTQQVFQPLLHPRRHRIIGLAQRSQGLMVAQGNPIGLLSLRDVAQRQARFVHRPLGSGTRVLLQDLLAAQGLHFDDLRAAAHTEPSHTAAAHAIAAGQADVALGPASAAQAQRLSFVPLAQEHYHLVCLSSALKDPAMAAFCALLRAPIWQQQLAALAGHTPLHCGEVLPLRALLPWWKATRSAAGGNRVARSRTP